MPPDIRPPVRRPDDRETTPVNIADLSNESLGLLIRQTLNTSGTRFVKTFYVNVGDRRALHYTLVSAP